MANVYTVHIHENYGRIVENDVTEIVRLNHSPGLSFDVFSDLAHRAFHLAGPEDTIELHIDSGVVFHCKGIGCQYG